MAKLLYYQFHKVKFDETKQSVTVLDEYF